MIVSLTHNKALSGIVMIGLPPVMCHTVLGRAFFWGEYMKIPLRYRIALHFLLGWLERRIRPTFDKDLSRKIDAVLVLLDN
jgi:hypothetical protein